MSTAKIFALLFLATILLALLAMASCSGAVRDVALVAIEEQATTNADPFWQSAEMRAQSYAPDRQRTIRVIVVVFAMAAAFVAAAYAVIVQPKLVRELRLREKQAAKALPKPAPVQDAPVALPADWIVPQLEAGDTTP